MNQAVLNNIIENPLNTTFISVPLISGTFTSNVQEDFYETSIIPAGNYLINFAFNMDVSTNENTLYVYNDDSSTIDIRYAFEKGTSVVGSFIFKADGASPKIRFRGASMNGGTWAMFNSCYVEITKIL